MTGMTMMFLAQPLLSSVASASLQQPQPKSFETWCRQRKSVPAATRHTIDILLEKAGSKDCQEVNSLLKTLTTLNLDGNEITDVKPLAGLTNLIEIDLVDNQITNVKPLAGLTNLTSLVLDGNQISDVKPLTGLTNLTILFLKSNPIAVKVCPIKPASICGF
jgi:internalin A